MNRALVSPPFWKRPDGSTITVNAKAVILTAGGFGANTKMAQKYNTYWPNIADDSTTTSAADGSLAAFKACTDLFN